MKKIITRLFNLIFPPRCLYCGKIVESPNTLCEECFNKINFITTPYCHVCGTPFETQKEITKNFICPSCATHKHLTRFDRSALLYDDFSKKGILALKFNDKLNTAKLFAKWVKLAGADIFEADVDLIIPVPLSYKRLLQRKYNQAALLAFELSKLTNIEVDVSSLKKVKHTKAQSSLPSKERLKNIKNAFAVADKEKIKNKRIVLIDDVMTTGATLTECAKVLLKAGAKSVDLLTIARVKKQ